MSARVLDLKEIPLTYGKAAVWIECRVKGFRPYVALYKYERHPDFVFVVSTIPDRVFLDKSRYRISWRAWNGKPTEAEIEAEGWETEPASVRSEEVGSRS